MLSQNSIAIPYLMRLFVCCVSGISRNSLHKRRTTGGKKKVKLLLGMLVTKCGQGAVKDVIPEEHMKLLTNIRKIQERKERKWGAKSEETKSHFSKATKSGQSM
ncbi:uncharacterized protein LOC107625839 isoform X2 [Arachis ipaensis]|uniref:uncharacterized protein LOC107625839 isoform X2 n=1 Tax=Arachis ipaensis TaxID=130454 RepID=UPI0007AF4AF5|nr:uncharacterized protein LOC107625839 isoform X2 [Arachis ipaensis]